MTPEEQEMQCSQRNGGIHWRQKVRILVTIPKMRNVGWLPNQRKNKIVRATFEGTEINVTTEGNNHLGAAVVSRSYLTKYVSDKLDEWVKEVVKLAEFETTQPQASYAVFTFGLKHRWTYFFELSLIFSRFLLTTFFRSSWSFVQPAWAWRPGPSSSERWHWCI